MRCITIYFHVLHGYKRFCCIRYTASTNSAYYSILYLYTQTNHVCDITTLNYTSITHCVGINWGTVAFYHDLTRITISDNKSEWIWHHSSRNNIRKNDTGLTGTLHFDIFEVLHGYKRFCSIRYTASTNSAYYCILYFYTQTNHVCDFITLNYTSMTHCVGIY